MEEGSVREIWFVKYNVAQNYLPVLVLMAMMAMLGGAKS